ncbi:MAG: DNA translocase FtsK 4TM domain-containing protein, partial [Alphaproteobacteria bacterium]|nr:DNA translocase FtsK 4TM domain-containing protein [Alphaproteobacteria bacterium]
MARPLVRSRRKSSALLPESLRDGMMRALQLVVGGLVIALAIGIALSLASYDPRDPSGNTALAGNTHIHNLCGRIGAAGADILWQYVGLGGFFLPVIIAAWGWR